MKEKGKICRPTGGSFLWLCGSVAESFVLWITCLPVVFSLPPQTTIKISQISTALSFSCVNVLLQPHENTGTSWQ